jgi:DNA-binding Lrp family transcriptional regulator
MTGDKVSHMRTEAPPLAPIFRSHLQARLIAAVLLDTQPSTIASLANMLAAPESTVHREVERLTRAGVFTDERIGRSRLVRPDDSNPAVGPLRELILIAYGPHTLISAALADVAGIDEAFIYGSWAARFHGEKGPSPNDIDLLVIGQPDRDDVYEAINEVGRQIHREVNPTFVTAQRWANRSSDPFLENIANRPLVALHASGPVTA